MKKVLVIINKSHNLFASQLALLPSDFERIDLPEEGLTLKQTYELAHNIANSKNEVVFASSFMTLAVILNDAGIRYKTFHNDKRSAKEVRDENGNVKVVHSVSATGWTIV